MKFPLIILALLIILISAFFLANPFDVDDDLSISQQSSTKSVERKIDSAKARAHMSDEEVTPYAQVVTRAELKERYASFSNEDFYKELAFLNSISLEFKKHSLILDELFRSWARLDFEEALEYIWKRKIEPAGAKFTTEQAFFNELAKLDFETAQIEALDLLEGDEQRSLFKAEYLSAVAGGAEDPTLGLEWISKLHMEDKGLLLSLFFKGVAAAEPDLAYTLINSLPRINQKEAIKGMADVWGEAAERWEEVDIQIDSLPSDLRLGAYTRALHPYAKKNPEHAKELIGKVLKPSVDKNRVIAQILSALPDHDAQGTLEWALKHSSESYTSHVDNEVFTPWLEKNPDEASAWLLEQPDTAKTRMLIERHLEAGSFSGNVASRLKAQLDN